MNEFTDFKTYKMKNKKIYQYVFDYFSEQILSGELKINDKILPKEILEMPKYGCVNVHASLLPKYRGAAPIQWAVINGDAVSGVTTMRMDAGLDTGDMIEKAEVVLAEDETGGSLFDR